VSDAYQCLEWHSTVEWLEQSIGIACGRIQKCREGQKPIAKFSCLLFLPVQLIKRTKNSQNIIIILNKTRDNRPIK